MDAAAAFLSVARLLPEGALLVTVSGRVIAANAAAGRAFGAPPDTLAGRGLAEFCTDDPQALQDWLRRCARTREMAMGAMTLRGVPPVLLRCEGALFQPGGASEALVMLRYQPRAAANARFAALTLQIGELAAEIKRRRRAEAALADQDRRKSEFLAVLSHELRNPLAPLSNALDVAFATSDPARRSTALEVMRRQLRHLGRLLDDLLDIARISTGRLELQKRVVELHAILDEAVEACAPLIEQHRHHLVRELPEAPLLLDADATRLTQVFANLLGNAARYTPPGGTIRLQVEVSRGWVAVSISDSGIGLEPEAMSVLFEMFARGAAAGRRSEGGLGVGLALVRRFTELHGGRVEAHSDGPDAGSRFTVHLPLHVVHEPEGVTPAAAASEALPAARRRVLVVDDNRDSADSLGTLVQLLGHDVRVAHDGAQALAVAEQHRPDLVVLDIGMPGMDGYEVAQRLRTRTWAAAATLVALTGWGQAADKARARAAGFDRHFVKPIEAAALEALLAERASGQGVSG